MTHQATQHDLTPTNGYWNTTIYYVTPYLPYVFVNNMQWTSFYPMGQLKSRNETIYNWLKSCDRLSLRH